jgi:hypothetical protein
MFSRNTTNTTNTPDVNKTDTPLTFARELEIRNTDGTTTNINNFDEFITLLFKTLDIDKSKMGDLKNEINLKFNHSNKYEIFLNPNIRNALQGLIESDSEINNLEKDFSEFFDKIEKEWNEMTVNLGKLQALILLKQIREGDCKDFTKKLVDALNKKITTVNEILEENLNAENDTRSTESARRKYLKYKNKYLNLQKKI